MTAVLAVLASVDDPATLLLVACVCGAIVVGLGLWHR